MIFLKFYIYNLTFEFKRNLIYKRLHHNESINFFLFSSGKLLNLLANDISRLFLYIQDNFLIPILPLVNINLLLSLFKPKYQESPYFLFLPLFFIQFTAETPDNRLLLSPYLNAITPSSSPFSLMPILPSLITIKLREKLLWIKKKKNCPEISLALYIYIYIFDNWRLTIIFSSFD